jgi:hypothetical protein
MTRDAALGTLALAFFSISTSAHAKPGLNGLVLGASVGYASLRNGPIQGGKDNVSYLAFEGTWAKQEGKNAFEVGGFVDYRKAEIAGSGERSFSSLGLIARANHGFQGGIFMDLKVDPLSYLFLREADKTKDANFLSYLGFGIGLGYRFRLAPFLYLKARLGYQSFNLAFPADVEYLPRTQVYEGSTGLTLNF